MLRVLVISLFVANLLLFAFQRNNPVVREEPRPTPAVKKNSGIPTIHLFSEMMQDQGLLNGNRQCFSLGPFHSSEDKDKFRLLLQEVSTDISERQTEALVEKGYWVFMPPYDSLLAANQALISLQALGLEDIAVIYDGEWKNAISLGYFMRQENAQRRKASIESRGYEPRIRVQRQSEPRYWLDFEQNPGSGLIALDMQNRPNDFMQRSLPCPEVETVEFAEEDSQQPAEVIAELEISGGDSEPATEPGEDNEDPDTGGDVENVPEEQVETLPVQVAETETEDIKDSGSGDTAGTGADNEAVTGQEDKNEAIPGDVPEDAIDTGQGDDTGTAPEDTAEAVQEDTIETLPASPDETVQEVAIDAKPERSVGTGPLEIIDITPEGAADTGSMNTPETGQEPAEETVPDDSAENGTGEG